MRLLTHHRIRHLPVMDGDRLVVSIGDLVNAVISGHRPPVAHRHGANTLRESGAGG